MEGTVDALGIEILDCCTFHLALLCISPYGVVWDTLHVAHLTLFTSLWLHLTYFKTRSRSQVYNTQTLSLNIDNSSSIVYPPYVSAPLVDISFSWARLLRVLGQEWRLVLPPFWWSSRRRLVSVARTAYARDSVFGKTSTFAA